LAREISRQTFPAGRRRSVGRRSSFGSGRVGSVRANADPNTSAWSGLSTAIGGQVLTSRGTRNSGPPSRFSIPTTTVRTPAAVVAVTSPADVAESDGVRGCPQPQGHIAQWWALLCGSVHGERNHGARPASAARGSPSTMLPAASVTVTPATSLYEIHQRWPRPAGVSRRVTCPSVGAAGHARAAGWRAIPARGPALRPIDLGLRVLPSGHAVTASANSNPDLFWGLRGGGGGNSGVTTSLTFATFPTGDYDVVNLNFPWQSFAQVLLGWQSWLRTADRNSWDTCRRHVGRDGSALPHLGDLPGRVGWQRGGGAITSAVGTHRPGPENPHVSIIWTS